jgi:adenylate cyclase class 2
LLTFAPRKVAFAHYILPRILAMPWEVEQKFPVASLAEIAAKLAQMNVEFGEPVEQLDHYFNHPSRDFADTDEALRLRQIGDRNFITYKGPRTDPTTKTRQEIELALPDGNQATAESQQLLKALGFLPVATVRKLRRTGTLRWNGWPVEIALDEVDRVGTYVELEIQADDSTLPTAKQALESLAARLNLTKSERRSYLELLLSGCVNH